MVSPWARLLDPEKYAAHLATVRDLEPAVAVGAHGPALLGSQVESAFLLFEELPYLPPADLVGQTELELLLAMIAQPQPA